MKDLYTIVTNRIIAALEQGTPPWVCPWRNGSGMPSNLVTNKSYRGINVLVLSMEMEDRNYADNRWLTFRQADQIGVRIRKGEHGVPIIFYRMREIGGTEVDGVDADTTKRGIPMLKSYTVFNATQLDGIPDRFVVRPTEAWQPIIEAEQIITKTGAVIRHGGNLAYYRPNTDTIQLPTPEWFNEPEAYYATALHELCHWTGHPGRLNRAMGQRKGIEAYAYEELIAEVGAAFMCANCGLSARLEHASYINNWLAALRHDKRLIFAAAGAAQKAADFVLGMADIVLDSTTDGSPA